MGLGITQNCIIKTGDRSFEGMECYATFSMFVCGTGTIGRHFLPNAVSIPTQKCSGLQVGRGGRSPACNLCVGSHSLESSAFIKDLAERHPVVKMCGITFPTDAAMAAESGASLIGMILWPNSKRSVSTRVAKEISKVARENGAEPVGVFVHDDVDTILRACDESNIELLQLHGDGSRAGFPVLQRWSRVIYVLHVDDDGNLLNHITEEDSSLADWILVDGRSGGRGKMFNWRNFALPAIRSKCGWLLAGGIDCDNVCEAIATVRPNGVDVSSGICGPDGIRKEPFKIASFMSKVRSVPYPDN